MTSHLGGRDFNLNGMMVLYWVELWCDVGWNDGVMLAGMMVLW